MHVQLKLFYVFVVHCPTNWSISNGYMRYSHNLSLVSFKCVSGYRLDGSSSVTCNENGTWSSLPPKCVGMYIIII